MTTLYVVTRTDNQEGDSDTLRVAHKSYYDAVTAVIEDMNSLVNDDDAGFKVDRANLDIHKIAVDLWVTGDLVDFSWTITEVTVEE